MKYGTFENEHMKEHFSFFHVCREFWALIMVHEEGWYECMSLTWRQADSRFTVLFSISAAHVGHRNEAIEEHRDFKISYHSAHVS